MLYIEAFNVNIFQYFTLKLFKGHETAILLQKFTLFLTKIC